mmetsp:Transcript_31431/g.62091  ORF Transcript_31431/g.62091 Transcript_31431/m.62091 type:complete len:105 (-) Transcript_31431:1636-1950(-)
MREKPGGERMQQLREEVRSRGETNGRPGSLELPPCIHPSKHRSTIDESISRAPFSDHPAAAAAALCFAFLSLEKRRERGSSVFNTPERQKEKKEKAEEREKTLH